MFALPSGSTRVLLVPGPVVALRSQHVFADVFLTKFGSCHSNFSNAPVSEVPLSRRVCLLSPMAQPKLCSCHHQPLSRAGDRNARNSRLALAAEKHYKTKHRNRGFAMAPSRPTGRRHTPNQPMERTPPCCALRRRSSARWASAWKQGVRCSAAAGNSESHV